MSVKYSMACIEEYIVEENYSARTFILFSSTSSRHINFYDHLPARTYRIVKNYRHYDFLRNGEIRLGWLAKSFVLYQYTLRLAKRTAESYSVRGYIICNDPYIRRSRLVFSSLKLGRESHSHSATITRTEKGGWKVKTRCGWKRERKRERGDWEELCPGLTSVFGRKWFIPAGPLNRLFQRIPRDSPDIGTFVSFNKTSGKEPTYVLLLISHAGGNVAVNEDGGKLLLRLSSYDWYRAG